MEKLLQSHLFTENDIYAGVDANGDILKELNSIMDWSLFEPILKKVFPQDKSIWRKNAISKTFYVQSTCYSTLLRIK